MKEIHNTQVLAPLNELGDYFRGIIREELDARHEKDVLEKLCSPEETCNLFTPRISKPTLESYSQRGLLNKYYLGGRTWFKYSEILQALKQIKKYSRNLTMP